MTIAEYSRENRFPFHTREQGVTISYDDVEDLYELNTIMDKIVDRFPDLNPEPFYARIEEIGNNPRGGEKVRQLKMECDNLLKRIKACLADEPFIHSLNSKMGFGLDKVIGTLYAVYGYYFYTGKRTANVIKKTIDGYKQQPIR